VGKVTPCPLLLDKSFLLVYNSKAKQAGDRSVFRKGNGEESPNIHSDPSGPDYRQRVTPFVREDRGANSDVLSRKARQPREFLEDIPIAIWGVQRQNPCPDARANLNAQAFKEK